MVREKLTEAARRFVTTLLLATGLTMPLLGVLACWEAGSLRLGWRCSARLSCRRPP